ncbi:MAG: hypothetical protein IPI78_14730 [Chitinophagaceae bacterium]|nr:hypothetical protein [Chitinophagaceae bacterium]
MDKSTNHGGKELDSEVLLEKKKIFCGRIRKINTWGDQVDLKEAMVLGQELLKPLTIPASKQYLKPLFCK